MEPNRLENDYKILVENKEYIFTLAGEQEKLFYIEDHKDIEYSIIFPDADKMIYVLSEYIKIVDIKGSILHMLKIEPDLDTKVLVINPDTIFVANKRYYFIWRYKVSKTTTRKHYAPMNKNRVFIKLFKITDDIVVIRFLATYNYMIRISTGEIVPWPVKFRNNLIQSKDPKVLLEYGKNNINIFTINTDLTVTEKNIELSTSNYITSLVFLDSDNLLFIEEDLSSYIVNKFSMINRYKLSTGELFTLYHIITRKGIHDRISYDQYNNTIVHRDDRYVHILKLDRNKTKVTSDKVIDTKENILRLELVRNSKEYIRKVNRVIEITFMLTKNIRNLIKRFL
mgnify:CR=1 FL=1